MADGLEMAEEDDAADDWLGRHDADILVPLEGSSLDGGRCSLDVRPVSAVDVGRSVSAAAVVVTERCAICLQPPDDPVLLHACYHVFCLSCIGYWVRHVASRGVRRPTCPLCKRSFQCALVDVVSETHYDVLRFDDGGRQWRERQRQQRRQRRPRSESDERLLRRSIVYRQQLRLVRVQDVTVDADALQCPLPSVKVKGEYESWARRELRACLGPDADLPFLMALLDSAMATDSLQETLEPFLLEDTARFVRELTWFLASRLQIPAYDDVLEYEMDDSGDNTHNNSECTTP
ncbi:hypothetical protein PINS_up001437 [Pythium insidiosum]|nr:hypothetical protein PINS_up001437 [Pythium insidiosum]